MIAPVCPACDHIGHPTIVAGSRFVPGPHKYRPADADGPLFGTRKEAEEWVCARRQNGVVELDSRFLERSNGGVMCDNSHATSTANEVARATAAKRSPGLTITSKE